MADDTLDQDFSLEDLPPEARSALAHDHPALNDYADRVSQRIGIPGILNALKNAGERSESGQTSPKGAQGVMQFIPATAKRYGLTDPTDPLASIDAAGKYVTDIAAKLKTQDPALIGAAYNAGENRPSLAQGRIPPIPETQAYAARVKAYMDANSFSAADLPDAPPPDIRTLVSKTGPEVHSTPEQANTQRFIGPRSLGLSYNVSPGMANFLAAVDRGVTDPVVGIGQRLKEGANALGHVAGIKSNLADPGYADQKIIDKYDAPLLQTGKGMAGYAVGSGIDSALLASVGGGGAAATLPRAALYGAGAGATMPVGNPLDVATNIGAGAVLGPLSQSVGRGLGATGRWLGNTTVGRDVIDGAQALARHIPGVPGILDKSIASKMTPSQVAAVDEGLASNIPVYKKSVTKPGYPVDPGQRAAQRDAYDRAISNSMGQDTSDLTAAMPAARAELSAGYNGLLDNRNIPLDWTHITDLKNISAYNAARSPRFAPNAELDDLVNRAHAAAMSGQPMSGRDYQQVMREYSAQMQKMLARSDTKAPDAYSAEGVNRLMQSLQRQAANTMTPAEQAQFRQLNTRWRNMMGLKSIMPKDAEGNVNPRALASKLATTRPDEFYFGEGDQTLPNLARLSSYMDLSPQPKQGMWADAKRMAAKTAPYLLGSGAEGIIAGSMMGGTDPTSLGKDAAIGLGLGVPTYLGLRAMRRAGNPALTMDSFHGLRGAIPQVARGAASPGALTRVLEAESQDGR